MTKMQYIIMQLNDPATWRGIFMLLTALGVALKPEQVAAITSAGMAVVGLIGVFAAPPAYVKPTSPPGSGDQPPV